MVCCYSLCIILMPILYHFVSLFNTGPSILHTLLQPERLVTFPYEVKRNNHKSILNLLFHSSSVLGFDQQILSLTIHTKQSHVDCAEAVLLVLKAQSFSLENGY
jgi:hypothetical protein